MLNCQIFQFLSMSKQLIYFLRLWRFSWFSFIKTLIIRLLFATVLMNRVIVNFEKYFFFKIRLQLKEKFETELELSTFFVPSGAHQRLTIKNVQHLLPFSQYNIAVPCRLRLSDYSICNLPEPYICSVQFNNFQKLVTLKTYGKLCGKIEVLCLTSIYMSRSKNSKLERLK